MTPPTVRRSILLAGFLEADRGPFLDRRAQIPGVAGEEDGHAVMVLGACRRILPRKSSISAVLLTRGFLDLRLYVTRLD